MNFTEMLNYFIGLLHTLIRFLPLGIYFFTYFSSAIYKDIRSALLLIGLILNDLIGYLYKQWGEVIPKYNCGVFEKSEKFSDLGFLSNTHTEFISFVSSFYFSDMYYKEKLDIIPFISLLVMFFLTIWSRMNVGCETSKSVIYNMIFGIIWGVLFYFIIKDYYINASDSGVTNKNKCDITYGDNYKCSEIKDGTVIIKNGSNESNDSNE